MFLQKSTQISESHCGPAVLEMLLDLLGVDTTQQKITKAADAEKTIEEEGLRVDQLALACSRIAPQTQFWFKHHSTLNDLREVLRKGYVVGVEWQSLFYDTIEEEEPGGDYGHYSIILDIDDDLHKIIMADPYKDFVEFDRIFDIDFFVSRWWDTNNVTNLQTGKIESVKDEQMSFFVTSIAKHWPLDLGYTAYTVVEPTSSVVAPAPEQASTVLKKPQREKRIKGLLQGRVRKTMDQKM